MSSRNQEPIFSNGDPGVIILDERDGVTDTTRRPVSEARRKEIQKMLDRQAEALRLMEAEKKSEKPEDKTPPPAKE